MELLKVNRDLCVKCGICAESCPNGIIGMEDEGPKLLVANVCSACGHCVAVCPYAALDNTKTPLANQKEVAKFPVIDKKTAVDFLRSRRSIRCYKKEKLTKEQILELLDIARYAPTGCNSQGVSYRVVQDEAVLKKVTALTIDWMEEQIQNGVQWAQGFAGIVRFYRQTGVDVILREAPHLILAIVPREFGMGHDNARFSLEYVELYATSLGLGTCWAGLAELAVGAGYPPMLEVLNIPEGTVVVGAMMVGYPKYTYQRLVERNPLSVTWL
ncbi:MAG TPA: nitroreductase family protein [Bacillota bacterium]|nr:nitroreductase family protein [Bacillota bacterium]